MDLRSLDALSRNNFDLDQVHGNRNQIPYYNDCYDDPACMEANQFSQPRQYYGTVNQTFIIDGSGVYVTRNGNYLHGRLDMSNNRQGNYRAGRPFAC